MRQRVPPDPAPPISRLDFRLSGTAGVPFEIGRLETTHRLGTTASPHRHSYYQIVWITQGAGLHATDFQEHAIEPEVIFPISPGQVHVVRVDRRLHGYMLLFTGDFLALEGPAADTTAIADLPLFRPGIPNPVITPTGEESHQLRVIAEDLLTEFSADAAWRRDMLRARLQTLLLALGRVALRLGVSLAPPASSVAQFQALVEERFRRVHRVSDYARLLALTPGHLNDLTKAATGQTASALIDSRLILEAKRLLAHSDAPTGEIAAELGFPDPSYFGRFFRRHVAQSPGAFRIAIREQYQRPHEVAVPLARLNSQ
jgi:AraC-like DNA-binding protein